MLEILPPLLPETASRHIVVQDTNTLKSKGPFSSLRGPHITTNFPDPCVIYHEGATYAFGTNNRKTGSDLVHVQVAVSTDNKTWDLQPHLDAMPEVAPWQTGNAVWAPDVKHLPGGRFLLYYTDGLVDNSEKHCIGAAISDSITGPYYPDSRPLICPHGGAIDPAGFVDRSTGKRYIIYKVDGNSLGHGGSCRNDVLPIVSTPLMLQEVDHDGVTLIGLPVEILDRDALDGPLVEAPAMYLSDGGIYFLFFSSNCFTTPLYNTDYATATNITGPYTRAPRPLLLTGDGPDSGFGIVGPGGLDIIHHNYGDVLEGGSDEFLQKKKHKHKQRHEDEGRMVVFHGQMTHHNMPQNRNKHNSRVRRGGNEAQRPIQQDLHMPFVRGMYSATIYFQGRSATLKTGGFKKAPRV